MTESAANEARSAFSVRSVFLRSDSFGGTALVALVIIGIALTLLEPQFLTASNLLNVGRQASVLIIVSCGMTIVILSGNIDLSVGSALALSAVVGASLSAHAELNAVATIFAMVALGALVGAVKGALVAWAGVNSFIVTLGMMTVLRGAALTFTGGYPIAGIPDDVRFPGFGVVAGVPMPLLVAAAVFVAVALLLSKTVLGRHTYAIGGNKTSSHIAGVPVASTIFLIFVINGVLCGVAAVVLLGRLGAGLPTSAEGMELDAIAAVILGGASLFGGRGSVFGTLFGALILACLQNGLNLLGVNSFIIEILSGAIIILAVLLDRFRVGSRQ